jgi:hypothetical protein
LSEPLYEESDNKKSKTGFSAQFGRLLLFVVSIRSKTARTVDVIIGVNPDLRQKLIVASLASCASHAAFESAEEPLL